jgi:hypothetical protein
MVEILTSIHGRRLGLGPDGELVLNNTGRQTLIGKQTTTTVTTAQVLALNATEQTVVPAPGAGLAIIPRYFAIHKPAGAAYAGIAAGEDLQFKWTDDSGAVITAIVETTGFLDQTTAQTRTVYPVTTASATPANTPIVLHLLTGEITTGDSDLHVRTWYDVIEIVF